MNGKGLFEPVPAGGWPEAQGGPHLGAGPATAMLAPMAMALRQQSKTKIVFLGHRDGSALMVRKVQHPRLQGLRGKRVAVPNRFSSFSSC